MNEAVGRFDKWQCLCLIQIALYNFVGTTWIMHVTLELDVERCTQFYKATIPYLLLLGTIK